jgi:hypothetical protein
MDSSKNRGGCGIMSHMKGKGIINLVEYDIVGNYLIAGEWVLFDRKNDIPGPDHIDQIDLLIPVYRVVSIAPQTDDVVSNAGTDD